MDDSRISLTSSMEIIEPDEHNESSSELDASWFDVGSAGGSSPAEHTRENNPQPSHNRDTIAPRPSYANYLHHRLRELLKVDEPDGDGINAFTLSQRISHVLREELATLFWKADGIEPQRHEEEATYCSGGLIAHQKLFQERDRSVPQTLRQSAYQLTVEQLRGVTEQAEKILSEAHTKGPSAGWEVLAASPQWKHDVDEAVRALLFHSRWLDDFHRKTNYYRPSGIYDNFGGFTMDDLFACSRERKGQRQEEMEAGRHLWAAIDERLKGSSERPILAPPLSATDRRQRVTGWLDSL